MRSRPGSAALPALTTTLAMLALVLLSWQLVPDVLDIDPLVFPRPWEVLRYLVEHPGVYATDTLLTFGVAGAGLVLGMLLGLTIAVLAWSSTFVRGVVTPPSLVMRSVPIVAVIPVIARLVGYNARTVVAVAILISFFPTYVFAVSGLRALPDGSADVFRVLGGSRWTKLVRLALPSAVPNLLTALRISAATCIAGALIAEYLMGTRGLGAVFAQSLVNFDATQAWGVAVIAVTVSLLAFAAASGLERWGLKRFE